MPAPKITETRQSIPESTVLRARRAVGATTCQVVGNLPGWHKTTKAYFTLLPTTASGGPDETRANHWSADIASTAGVFRFTNMEYRGGAPDAGHATGTHVQARIESGWARDLGELLDTKSGIDTGGGGSSVLEGTTAPTASQGEDGDLYIQKDNVGHTLELFLKEAGAWGFIASVPQDGNLQTVLRAIDGQLSSLGTKDTELQRDINNLTARIGNIPDTQTFNEMIADPSADARVYDASNLAEATATRDTIDGDYYMVLREIGNLNLSRAVDIDSVRIYAVGSDLSTTELHREAWTLLQDRRTINFNISDAEKTGAAGKIQRADGRDFYHIRVSFFVGNAEADSKTATLWIVGTDRLKAPASSETADTIKTKLETLAGTDRLSATAIKDLPSSTSADTAAQIRDKLAGLAGNARLDATAVQNLPVVVPSIYVSPSTFTKSAGARSIYVSLNSRYTNANNVHFNIGGVSKNVRYGGGREVLQVDLTTTDVANLRNAPDPVIRVQANIRDSSNTELERLEVDILKVDPATGSGTAETAQQIIDKLFDPVVVDIAGANTSLAFDVGTAADVSGSARTYTSNQTYTISAGQFGQGDTLTADYVVNNPVIQGSDPFDVEVRMLKSSDNSVIDTFNIGKSAGGQLTHILEEADTIKFQLNIKTPGRYAGTLVISNLQIQSSVPPAQPDVRKVMAKPLSDLEQRLQNDLTRSGSYSIDTIAENRAITTNYSKMLFVNKLRSSGADISIDSDSLITLSPGQYKIEVHYIVNKASGAFANNRANLKSRIVNTSNGDAILDEQASLGYARGAADVNQEGVYAHHLIVSGNGAHKLRLDMGLAQFESGNTWQTAANGRITIYKIAGALRGEKGDKGDPGSGGLNQAAVDARVGALVQDPAKTGNNDRWPATKLPTTVPSTTNLQITNIWFGTQTQYDALPSSQKNNNNYLHYVQS